MWRFGVPIINFDAKDYYELIDWQNLDLTEPPATQNMTNEVLQGMIASKNPQQLILFPSFPCHTQAVERCIKLVTEASGLVCGVVSRDGFIRSHIQSRSEMPHFESTCDYFVWFFETFDVPVQMKHNSARNSMMCSFD